MEKFEDDFDEFEDDAEARGGRFLPIAVVLIALLAVGGLGWYAFHSADQEAEVAGVPTIKADDESIREKPEDEGGMEIPHQDRAIYDTLNTPSGKTETATVKDTTEEPVERPKAAVKKEPAKEPAPEPKKVERLLDDEEPVAKSVQPVVTEKKAAPGEAPAPVPAAEADAAPSEAPSAAMVADAPQKPVTQPVKQVDSTPSDAASADLKPSTPPPGVRIQLGAFRSENEAVDSWKKILGKNKDVLANKVFTIRKADLGEKGVYYRLQVGSFASATEAKEACKTLNQRKLGCFVAK